MSEEGLFDRFTEQARQVLTYAQEEAHRFNHNYIGTEHLLLGLVRQQGMLATLALKSLGVHQNKVRSTVEFIIGRGNRIVLGEAVLTPRAKKTLALAKDEAQQLQHDQIGPEHILLGIMREGESIAVGVLESLGVNLEKVRARLLQLLQHPGGPEEAAKELAAERNAEIGEAYRAHARASQQAALQRMFPEAFSPRAFYTPLHIQASHPSRTPIGAGGAVMLGLVVIGTGGSYTLALYDGLAPDAPSFAVIANPKTGDVYLFHIVLERGLSYTLEGDAGSVTFLYTELSH